MIKKIVLTIMISLLLYNTAYAECETIRRGMATVAWGKVWVFYDTNCDGLWNIVKVFKMTSKGYVDTGEQFDCPQKYILAEVESLD